MKIIFKHPGKSSYHDNAVFVRVTVEHEGVWLLPGQHIAIVTEDDIEAIDNEDPHADPGPEWDDFCRNFKAREWQMVAVREPYAAKARAAIRDALKTGWTRVGRLHRIAGTWIQYMKKRVE